MNSNDIILKPVISEKTTELMGINKYVFRVSMKANKLMVAHAVKELFGVEPEKVNVMTVRGKNRRLRYQDRQAERMEEGDCNAEARRKNRAF